MSNDNESKPRPNENKPQRESVSGVIVIELGNNERNTNPYIECGGGTYRGIYRRANRSVAERWAAENEGVVDLPGFYVEVDVRNATISLYDPLTRPQYQATREQIEHHLANPPQSDQPISKQKYTPLPDQVTKNCSNELIVGCLMEMYRLVDARAAQLRQGEIPKSVVERVKEDRANDAAEVWGKKNPLPQLV